MKPFAILITTVALSAAYAQNPKTPAINLCEKILDNGTGLYASTRASLRMSRPAIEDADDQPRTWEFGHNIQGEFYELTVRGAFDRLSENAKNELLGMKGREAKVIGRVADEIRIVNEHYAFPRLERIMTLNDDVKVQFQLIEKNRKRYWVVIFD